MKIEYRVVNIEDDKCRRIRKYTEPAFLRQLRADNTLWGVQDRFLTRRWSFIPRMYFVSAQRAVEAMQSHILQSDEYKRLVFARELIPEAQP